MVQIEETQQVNPANLITTAVLKQHLRVEHDEDDALIDTLRGAAFSYLESYTGARFGSRTANVWLDHWRSIEIPARPVTAISAVKYYDANGDLQTLDGSKYFTDTVGHSARVRFVDVPALEPNGLNRVKIETTLGYATTPDPILAAVKLLVGHLYEQRANEIVGTISSPLIVGAHALANPFRVLSFA